MSSAEADEIVALLGRYRSRGRKVDTIRWGEEHLVGRAVVAETAQSVYVFVPVYGGRGGATGAPGGGSFRFAGFDAASRNDPPRILVGRPYDATVGRPLEISLAKQQKLRDEGVTIGRTVMGNRTVATSRLVALYVLTID